jgi:hypothetical protein
MADTKVTDLAALTAPAAGDLLPIVDVSDTSMAGSGTDKKITYANLLAAVPTHTGGLLANLPAANSVPAWSTYYATDDNGGTLYKSDGTNWLIASAGSELDYAENTGIHQTASLAAGNYEDVTNLSITFTARGRPVLLEAGGSGWLAATSGGRPELLITDNSNVIKGRARYTSANTGQHHNPYARRRLGVSDLTAGTSYTFKARLGNGTSGTTSIIQLLATADSPSYLQATEK